MKIKEGDVFSAGATYILHQVNCQGVMGSGVAKQAKTLFPNVFYEYKRKCDTNTPKELLGTAQLVETQKTYGTEFLGVFNLFAQENYGYDGKRYTDYDALRKCLIEVDEACKNLNYVFKPTVAIPYLMGCDRGGGDWNIVSKIIEETLTECDVYCYKLKG